MGTQGFNKYGLILWMTGFDSLPARQSRRLALHLGLQRSSLAQPLTHSIWPWAAFGSACGATSLKARTASPFK